MQSNILTPCGISGMRIAGNTLRQRAPNEVVYVGQYDEDPYKINVARMDSCAGWLATPSALVRFLDHVAGSGNIPSMLKPETTSGVRDDIHSQSGISSVVTGQVRERVDGWRGKLVAQRQSAWVDDHYGAHSEWPALGWLGEHAHRTARSDRHCSGCNDVEYGPQRARVGCLNKCRHARLAGQPGKTADLSASFSFCIRARSVVPKDAKKEWALAPALFSIGISCRFYGGRG